MVENTVIFVEGDPRLREGFDYLFFDYVQGRRPFNMCKGKTDAIKKYIGDKRAEVKCLLVDLDANATEKANDVKANQLEGNIAFMIQEMESWFLSQPEHLDLHFNLKISDYLKAKYKNLHASEIGNPKSKLKGFVKEAFAKGDVIDANRKTRRDYDEIGDAIVLLKKLNLAKLAKEYNDVQLIIDILK